MPEDQKPEGRSWRPWRVTTAVLLAVVVVGIVPLVRPVSFAVGNRVYFARVWRPLEVPDGSGLIWRVGIPDGYRHRSGPGFSLTTIRIGNGAYLFGWHDAGTKAVPVEGD